MRDGGCVELTPRQRKHCFAATQTVRVHGAKTPTPTCRVGNGSGWKFQRRAARDVDVKVVHLEHPVIQA
jgi:hypothetical protein